MTENHLSLEQKDFHSLKKINSNKTFEIQIMKNENENFQSFLFSKEEILILSSLAYDFISLTREPFQIKFYSYFNVKHNIIDSPDKYLNDFLEFNDCFNQLVSLFSTKNSICINDSNQKYFKIIAFQLQNKSFSNACESFDEFYFSSDNFQEISYYFEKDLTIKLKRKIIKINSVFSSLISHKIFKHLQIYKTQELDFEDFDYPKILLNILMIQNGDKFIIDKYPLENIIKSMLYLQVPILKYQYLLSLVQQFETVLSSPSFYIENEQILFDLILKKISENQEFAVLIKYLHFGLCNRQELNDFIESFLMNQIDFKMFPYIKMTFYFNYLVTEKNLNLILIISSENYELYNVFKMI